MAELAAAGALLLAGYLLGSVPSGLLLVRWRHSRDIRLEGSGNIGASNVLRGTGFALGAVTLLLDASKGALASGLAHRLAAGRTPFADAVALAAVLGHVYPPWLGFRGGKGVATACGAFGLLHPYPMLGALIAFAAGVGISRWVSVGSLAAVLAYPALAAWRGARGAELALALAAALLILWTHRENMRRLALGTEAKLPLFRGARRRTREESR